MRPRSATYLGIAAFPLAVLGVHRLRYLLAYGDESSQQLQAQGHAYLGVLGPVLMVVVAAAMGAFLGRLAGHWQGSVADRSARTRRIWLVAALALIAVYTTQETLEGLLATGHPGGLEGVFGNGGLWALPCAGLLAGGLALLMRGGEHVVRAARSAGAALARRATAPRLLAPATPVAVLVSRTIARASAPLAELAAGRGPPAVAALR